MTEALVLGTVGSSALVIGALLGTRWAAPAMVTGILLAFASGTLVAALAFELFPEAVHLGGLWPAAGGLLAGAATFVVANTWLDSRVAGGAGDPDEVPATGGLAEELSGAEAEQHEKLEEAARVPVSASRPEVGAVGLALLAAVTLDGVPENLALGVSLLADEAGSVTLLVAIFASNLPESLVGAVAMRRAGRSSAFTLGVWVAAAVALTLAVVAGRQLLAGVHESTLAFPLAFAGGAVLASLADTLMPEAFEHGRPLNSFATAAGFFISFVLANTNA